MSLIELQSCVAQWVNILDKVIPQDINLCTSKVVEEAAEIHEAIEQGQSKQEIAGEIGDAMFVLFSICNIMGIDAQEAMEQTLDKNWRKINQPKIDELRRNGWEGMELYNEAKRLL